MGRSRGRMGYEAAVRIFDRLALTAGRADGRGLDAVSRHLRAAHATAFTGTPPCDSRPPRADDEDTRA